MKLIDVKFCGGCNPQIDRSRLFRELGSMLDGEFMLVTGHVSEKHEKLEKTDILILICGCPVACVDRPEIREGARHSILVSGPMVDLNPLLENKIASKVAETIVRLDCGKDGGLR